ncbi:FMN reductase [Cellulomonas marina]|uniref:FMN reductase n=1 Tax=Cellulomonas marina TaxID=988821 RepID=A0A1I0XHH2_9CELL|nr:FMN reductase [Cellulomonas marina]GIG29877.1 FMN reductase [Cellulomonas marina]SFA99403.1 FMN reductase [Cellulomonas marina]
MATTPTGPRGTSTGAPTGTSRSSSHGTLHAVDGATRVPAPEPRRLVVLAAGLSQPSSTRLLADRLASATVEELEARGVPVEVRTLEVRDLAHDVVNRLLTGFPSEALTDALEAVDGADALIAVTPIFAATASGLFTSFVDVIDKDALTGKPVLLGATGGTARHSLAVEHGVRPLFTYLRAHVESTAVFAATDDWGSAEDALPSRIRRAGAELAATVAARPPVVRVDEFDDVPSFEQLLGNA